MDWEKTVWLIGAVFKGFSKDDLWNIELEEELDFWLRGAQQVLEWKAGKD